MTTEYTQLLVSDGTEMQAYTAHSAVPAKGMIVIQEAFGVNEYIRRMTDRFTALDYLAIAPELFHRTAPKGFESSYTNKTHAEHMAALTDEGEIADIQASYDWLLSQGIAADKIAIIGFCMGGRASFLANAALPIAAAVSFYGGGIAQTLLSRTDQLHAPQLLIWGGSDPHILSEHTRKVADALTTAGKPFVEATFSRAGHGFACDARDAYHPASAREAWALTDAFLAEHMI